MYKNNCGKKNAEHDAQIYTIRGYITVTSTVDNPNDRATYNLICYLSYICKDGGTPWRNGSASDSRSEGCVFKSRRGQNFFLSKIKKLLLKNIQRKKHRAYHSCRPVHKTFSHPYTAWLNSHLQRVAK